MMIGYLAHSICAVYIQTLTQNNTKSLSNALNLTLGILHNTISRAQSPCLPFVHAEHESPSRFLLVYG